MQIAIQMDHIASITTKGDTSFALLLAAQEFGHQLYHYTPDRLSIEGKELYAYLEPLQVVDIQGEHYKLGEARKVNLATMDVVLLRQDPPFDMNYITSTYMLDFIKKDCLVLNDPFWVRNSPEKIFVMQFSEFMPKTLITKNSQDVLNFRDRYGDVIIKPLYGNGGDGVFLLRHDDLNLQSLLGLFEKQYQTPFIVQEYLPRVTEGDKRIILLNGEIAGAINRVAKSDEVRSNLHVGGVAEPCKITEKEKEICAVISPWLKERGLFLTGIDIIGDKITEINVTSPTGIREIKQFYDIDIAKNYWITIENSLKTRET